MTNDFAAFDHRDPGPPAEVWDELIRDLPALPTVGAEAHLVVLAAHPDDETLGAGGLLATAAARGARITVVVATDGEASHPDSPTVRPAELGDLRRREVHAAVARLAPSADLHLLALPDGALAAHEPVLAAALDELVDAATHVVTPWSADRHPDHEACARVGAALASRSGAQHWQYPIWAWHWDRPDGGELAAAQSTSLRLDTSAAEAKRSALDCHRSQHSALSDAPGDEVLLPGSVVGRALSGTEVFVVGSTPRSYFERLYRSEADPWGLDTRFYERRKRAALLAALPRQRFRRAFEPGCATGALSVELADRCDRLVAWDVVDRAVATTAQRLGPRDAEVARGSIPDEWPDGRFDLVVLSEVGYYCSDLRLVRERVESSLTDDGVVVACHWRHRADAHPHTAGAVHAVIGAGLHLVVSHVEDDFLLQVWSRTGQSVAQAEGIIR